jgi:hypothetical protein
METKIKPLTVPLSPSDPAPDRAVIGQGDADGSPSIMVDAGGNVLAFADAFDDIGGGVLQQAIVAVRDGNGALGIAWRSILADQVMAAPALDEASETLVVSTVGNIYVFKNVAGLTGNVPAPAPLGRSNMITCVPPGGSGVLLLGSPIGLTFDPAANALAAYTNFQFKLASGAIYSYLGAFSIPLDGSSPGLPLWCSSLNPTQNGDGQGLGTYGQPALFEYKNGSGQTATGLIVNTLGTGTYIFK